MQAQDRTKPTTFGELSTSRYLSAADVPAPITVTIEDFWAESPDPTAPKKLTLQLREFEKPLLCNSTNRKALTTLFGTPDRMVGQRIQLFVIECDFKGELTQGLRVRQAPAAPRQAPRKGKAAAAPAPPPQPEVEPDEQDEPLF